MGERHRNPRQIDWSATRKVRNAIARRRYILSVHVEEKLPKLGLSKQDFLEVVAAGFVLCRRERDEVGNATDGYKHFLEGLSAAGAIIEAVLKFVASCRWQGEELMILITAYRGKA